MREKFSRACIYFGFRKHLSSFSFHGIEAWEEIIVDVFSWVIRTVRNVSLLSD
jgi:hypothetical protein